MTGALRAIVVTVEEPEPGAFVWVRVEQDGGGHRCRTPKRPAAATRKAMADGLLALQDLIEGLQIGPRMPEVRHSPAERAPFGFGFGGLKQGHRPSRYGEGGARPGSRLPPEATPCGRLSPTPAP